MISLGCCNLHFLNLTASSFSPGTKPRAHPECAKLGIPGKVKVGGSGRGTKFHHAHPAQCEQCSQMVPQVKPLAPGEGEGVLWVSRETSETYPAHFQSKEKAPCCLEQAQGTFWPSALMVMGKLQDSCQGARCSLNRDQSRSRGCQLEGALRAVIIAGTSS